MQQQSIEIGMRFGRWEVVEAPVTIRRANGLPRDQGLWCRCDCGIRRLIAKYDLIHAKTRSCGCLSRELAKTRTTHGGSRVGRREPLYGVLNDVFGRCNKPSNPAYAYYGGRGIQVCKEWLSYATFRAWALANGYTEGLTLDRIDNDGPYAPDNCRWVDRFTQMNNTRANHWVEAFGERHTIAQWARDPRCNVGRRRLNRRIANGWDTELAITAPVSPPERFLAAFGETKTIAAWIRDPRCVVGGHAFRYRIKIHWPVEAALTMPLGVVKPGPK